MSSLPVASSGVSVDRSRAVRRLFAAAAKDDPFRPAKTSGEGLSTPPKASSGLFSRPWQQSWVTQAALSPTVAVPVTPPTAAPPSAPVVSPVCRTKAPLSDGIRVTGQQARVVHWREMLWQKQCIAALIERTPFVSGCPFAAVDFGPPNKWAAVHLLPKNPLLVPRNPTSCNTRASVK